MKNLQVTLQLLFLICISGQAQVYSDLYDYGYKQQIRSITTRFYKNISDKNGTWEIEDTLQPGKTFTYYFNTDGNFIKQIFDLPADDHEVIYTYVLGIKTGWVQIDSTGDTTSIATRTQNEVLRYTETVNDTKGNKKYEDIYIIGKDQKTERIINRIFDNKGEPENEYLTIFKDDKTGHLHTWTSENKIKHTTDSYELVYLERDSLENPVKVLQKKNGKAVEMRMVKIEYQQ